MVDDNLGSSVSISNRFALYRDLISQFLSQEIAAGNFVDSVLALWREDRARAWADKRGESNVIDRGLTPQEFKRVEVLFFLVDDFDEEADIGDQYIGEAELRSRLTQADLETDHG